MSDRLNDDLDPRDARTRGQDADDDSRDDDTAIIEADIRETRERLGDTVEEIGERLNPRRLSPFRQRLCPHHDWSNCHRFHSETSSGSRAESGDRS